MHENSSTSNSEKSALGRLLTRACAFLVPLALLLALPTFIIFKSGEAYTSPQLARLQSEPEPTIIGLAYSGGNGFKLESILAREPKILAAGTSRSMGFRDIFFRNPRDFYNAGGMVVFLPHALKLLKILPKGALPKVLILGLDQNFFNPAWAPLPEEVANAERNMKGGGDARRLFTLIFQRWPNLLSDWRKGSFAWSNVLSDKLQLPGLPVFKGIGLSARASGEGTLRDGSHLYGYVFLQGSKKRDPEFSETIYRIRKESGRFEPGDKVGEKSLEQLGELADFCRDSGIHLVSFLPSFAPKIWNYMQESRKYSYMQGLSLMLDEVLKGRGFKVHDFSVATSFGASDEEFIDGFHPSEVTYARMILKISEIDPVLASYVDRAALESRLGSRPNPYILAGQ